MERLQEEENFKFSKIYLKGLCLSFMISLVCILILSILLSMTNIKESMINPGIIFISCLSILISSFMISKKIKKKGIINGAIFGAVYMMILYIISSLISMKFSLSMYSIYMIALGIVGGIIGGIIGVNL